MTTLAEIEAAAESLPRAEQEELMAFLAQRVRALPEGPFGAEDPFESVIGAFTGPTEATGQRAEEILYGTGA